MVDMGIASFNRKNVKEIREEFEAALQTVADKYGLKVASLGGGSFTSTNFTTGRVDVAIASSQSNVEEMELKDFIGKRYKAGSRTFTIIEIKDGKLVGRTNRGARYNIRIDQIAEMIELYA